MSGKAIVVGYDGSPGARDALDFAVEAARPGRTAVVAVHVQTPPPPTDRFASDFWSAQSHELQHSADRVLAEAADHARNLDPDVDFRGKPATGSASKALLDAAEGACMLVVGSRGLGALSGRLVGSTGVQVALHAQCPVVVVRPSDSTSTTSSEAGRVVVGIDGSPSSEAVLAFAIEQASGRGVGLTALLAWDVDYLNVPGRIGPIPPEVLQAGSDHARTVLSEVLAGWQERYPDVDIKTRVDHGQARSSLIDASAGASLLVVGSRGRGGFLGLLLGSVSLAVLHNAHCPVAVVHQGIN